MWPITSVSASSTMSLSMSPEPGIDGPPVWIVLLMPYLRAQATILPAVGPSLTPPSAEEADAGGGKLLEIMLLHSRLDHRRARVHLYTAGAKVRKAALRSDR